MRFEHLNVDAEAYVGNRGVPTFLNFFVNKIMVGRYCFGSHRNGKIIDVVNPLLIKIITRYIVAGNSELSSYNSERKETDIDSSRH